MSTVLENWIQGKGLPDTLVIDGHIHIGAWRHNYTFLSPEEAAEKSVHLCDAHGIDAFCSVAGGYTHQGADYRKGNDFLLDVWRMIPDRMIPFLSVNPNDSESNIISELDRMYSEGVRCIKLINRYQENYPGDGPNLMILYEYASEHNMIVFNHAWTNEVIMEISEMFPGVTFIFGHYSNTRDPVLNSRPNVYTNIWNYGNLGWIDRGIANCGPEKFMLGSDGFLNPLSAGIGPVVFSSVSDDDKRCILGLNCARLLDTVGALPENLKLSFLS